MRVLCGILGLLAAVLAGKLWLLRRDLGVLSRDFAARLASDTNVGLDSRSSDRRVRALAAELDGQLHLLRKQRLRYEQGDRALKDAVTGLSHDLRTPLTAIRGYLELLEREELPPEARAYLRVISGRVEAMGTMTGELLQYSVVRSAGDGGRREPVNLGDALAQSLADFYGAFRKRRITPEITLPPQPVVRSLQPQALGRILSNVISNALRYSTGDFRVTLADDGTITFQNHAQGLDEVQLGHLFDRFFTVSSGRDGTGLGLSIARTLAGDLGGSLEADLQAGLFTLTLRFPG